MTEHGIGNVGQRYTVGRGRPLDHRSDLELILNVLGVELVGWIRPGDFGHETHLWGMVPQADLQTGHTVPCFRIRAMEAPEGRDDAEGPPGASPGV